MKRAQDKTVEHFSSDNDDVEGNQTKKARTEPFSKPRFTGNEESASIESSALPRLSAAMFVDPSKWKCNTCMTFNEKHTIQCICCEAYKPGTEPPDCGPALPDKSETSFPTTVPTKGSSSIGAKGFTFGGGRLSSAPVKPASQASITAGGFSFKGPASTAATGVGSQVQDKMASSKPGLFVFGAAENKAGGSQSSGSATQKCMDSESKEPEEKITTESLTVGLVATFGSGDCAQLGHGEDVTELPRPRILKSLSEAQVTFVVAGGMHNLARTVQGKLYSWGCNDDACLGRAGDETTPGEVIGIGEEVVSCSAGNNHSAVLTKDSSLWLWGTYRGDNGHIGFNKKVKKMHSPMKMELRLPRSRHLAKISGVSCGADHTAVVTSEGRVFTWGAGAQGQLGRKVVAGREVNGLEPRLVILERGRQGAGLKAKSVHCGSHHTFVVTVFQQPLTPTSLDYRVYGFGLNNFGQLGLGDRDDRHVPSRSNEVEELIKKRGFRDLSCGVHHSIMLCEDGKLFGCGRTDSGQLGVLDTSTKCRTTPIPILGVSEVTQISCGGNHNLALLKDGNIYSWGYGEMLQLGNCREADETKPFQIVLKGGKKASCVAAGGQHSMILVKKEA